MKAIYQWVLRTMMKDQTGVMQTLPKKDLVDFNVAMTAERLMRNGIDPNALKNANQVENAINQIEAPRNVQQGIRNTESAKVFDMEGKEIPKGSKIMGGRQAETEAEIAARISKENKESAARMKNTKMIDDAIDNASPGFSGDTKIDAELVAEDLAERMGLVYDDLPTKQRLDIYDQAYTGLSKQRFKGMKKPKDDVDDPNYDAEPADFDPDADNETFADGGVAGLLGERVGFVKGGLSTKILNFLKGLTKEKPFSGKEFVDKRKFIRADKIENKIQQMKNEKILKEAQEEFKKNPPFKFPEPGDKEYDEGLAKIQRALIEDRKLNADGGRAGFFMGGPSSKGLGLLRQILNYMSKKGIKENRFKGQNLSGLDMLRFSNPKAYNKMLNDPNKLFMRGREGIMATDMVKDYQKSLEAQRRGITEKSLDVAKAMKKDQDKIKIRIEREAEKTIIPEVKERLMRDLGMSDEAAEKAARDMAEAAQNIKLMDSPPEITDEGILQLENVLKNLETGGKKKRELNATGGRIGFKIGGIDKARRAFLTTMGAAGAGIGALKMGLLKLAGKGAASQAAKEVVKSAGSGTPPPYFFKLVDRIQVLGDDVTKKQATKAREVVTEYKDYKLTEDLDTGELTIQKNTPNHNVDTSVPTSEEVYMNYKPGKSKMDETTKGETPPDEYTEDTSYVGTSRGDKGGIMHTVDGVPDEVIEEGSTHPSFKSFGAKKARDKYLAKADGGRIGFDEGGMTRRTFLKILGGLAAIPIVGKIIKPIKLASGVKKVPIIKTDNVPGKPEWFDALVNKVIIEGDDVTKRFATGERQSIHQKTLDDGSVVRVTEDVDDGAVRVEYESEQNTFADTVQMQYKKPLPDEGDPRPVGEFTTAESGPVGRSVGPDDYDIDVDEVGGTSIRDLDSDVSKLKEYATGKKLTMKEIVEAKKRKDRAKLISEDMEAQSDAVIRRQGDADDSFYSGSDYGDVDDFASGGIARMLGE